MMLSLILFASLSSALALPVITDCPHPNGTDTAVHYFNCDAQEQLQLKHLEITDDKGNPMYPFNPAKPIVVNEQSMNSGGEHKTLRVDVDLWHYGGSTGACAWQTVPTLGLLHNLDGCAIAKNCPIEHGEVDMNQQIDLTPFQAIIHTLGNNQVYQLRIVTKDGATKEQIGCVYAQGLLKF